jgi:hypothetical protein
MATNSMVCVSSVNVNRHTISHHASLLLLGGLDAAQKPFNVTPSILRDTRLTNAKLLLT